MMGEVVSVGNLSVVLRSPFGRVNLAPESQFADFEYDPLLTDDSWCAGLWTGRMCLVFRCHRTRRGAKIDGTGEREEVALSVELR